MLNNDLGVMKSRIDDYVLLRNKYFKFVKKLPYNDEYIEYKNRNKCIWICWFQGIDFAPNLVKKCIERIKNNFFDYQKIIITKENFKKYVEINDTVVEKWNKGIITNTAFSNILRLEILIKYGGIWMDATVLVTGNKFPNYIEDTPLFMYSSWKWLSGDVRPISTWFISAQKNHPLLMAVRDCLIKYWQDNDELITYFIFHMFFAMVMERYPKMFSQIPRISNIPPHMMQFELQDRYSSKRFSELIEMSPIHKLTYKLDKKVFSDVNNLYNFILKEL